MPQISQHYSLNLMALSPLHIGTGRELLRDYDYAVHKGYTWRIDEDALLDAALGEGEFDETLLRRPAAELLQPDDFRPDASLFRYVVKGIPRSKQKGAHLREQIKNVFDQPYLPGSSLKGAFRTAIFDHALAQNPQALDTRRLKDNRKWAAQPIERALLGRNPNYDLLRALHVADSIPLPANKSLSIENVQVITGGQPGSPIEVEALRTQVRLRASVKLDLSLFTAQAERELHLKDRLQWLQGLMTICRARVTPILAAERDWFAKRYPRSPVVGFYAQLHDLVTSMPDHRCLLQVGWGGGWINKTVGQRLDDRQREDVIRNYRLARGKRQRGDPFPRSRRVVLDTQGQPVAPLGWVLIEMKPEVTQ
ncbi:MAG: type III-A CRISPR-associated RAMP protein Csm5 [Chloroflexi bacterium]|nr:type III-A CRISPR-associated RAMP protein Csm5 [Chloroflexota bacterium]